MKEVPEFMRTSGESDPVKLVFVVGVGHSGSTLLGRMMDTHPRVFCVGEMARIERALNRHRNCKCGEPLSQCPFWARLLPEIEALSGYDFRRFSPALYERLCALSGKDMIVDLSKTRVYRMARWWRYRRTRFVFLVRDPRGVVASAVRAGRDLERSLRKNQKWTARLHRFTQKKGQQALTVFYEDLAARPETELRRICGFLGLDFRPEMLRPADGIHHFVLGSVSPYLQDSNEVRVDERWRSVLSSEQIGRIDRAMAGIKVLRDRYLDSGTATDAKARS